MGLTMQNPRSIEQAALEETHKNLEVVKRKEKNNPCSSNQHTNNCGETFLVMVSEFPSH